MRHGPIGAEDLVSRAMEELAVLLARLKTAYEAKNIDNITMHATTIRNISNHIGMDQLAKVAETVITLADSHDAASLAAVTARLHRLGECSLLAVWDISDVYT